MDRPGIQRFQGQRVHMVGVGGSSMSGLAEMLCADGFAVSGSDTADGYALAKLKAMGVDVRVGHRPEMVAGAGLLAYSAAISHDDPERAEARLLGIEEMERAVLLGEMMRGHARSVCVCGTHGKTTTTAMAAQTLLELGLDPSIHLGGSLDAIGGSVRWGNGGVFIAEACEFNRSFLHMPVTVAIVLNIEEDHLDCYGDMEHVEEAYRQFLELLPDDGIAVVNGDDVRVMRVVSKLERKNRRVLTFGVGEKNDYAFSNLHYDAMKNPRFTAVYQGKPVAGARLQIPGLYNALHALAVLAACHALGLDTARAAETISSFTGAHRRLEHTGTVQGIEMYHDYGHNPAEMQAAIGMLRPRARRFIAVMQPHTYSRVKTLFNDYIPCTKEADITLVTDIYAAREKDPGDIHATMLVSRMRDAGIDAHYTPGFGDVENWLLQNGRPGDLALTMGCGDINLLNDLMQKNEAARAATGEV